MSCKRAEAERKDCPSKDDEELRVVLTDERRERLAGDLLGQDVPFGGTRQPRADRTEL
jgi:hypothetical protein